MDAMVEMDRWLAMLGPELGLPDEVLTQVKGPLLDLVRDVAHGVARPAGAMTAFLVGLAAGIAAEDPSRSGDAALEQIERVSSLAAAWEPQEA